MKSLFFLSILFLPLMAIAQNVGIGTTNPNAKAALEVTATDKGVLFPRLTSAQRNAITDPPDGLHLFNTDERCLNYYDSLFQVWNCYCETDTCKIVTVRITANTGSINFNTTYASQYPGKKKFVMLIYPGVTVNSTGGAGAIDFSTMTANSKITIINRGYITGHGGLGGNGATGNAGGPCNRPAVAGSAGGNAIATIAGIAVTINNYGTVAGGGGGGGGGGRTIIGEYGGGGGGGAGLLVANGGTGGGVTISTGCFPICGCGTLTVIAQSGQPGTSTTGSPGGTGANGAGAGNGGAGGARAQVGQNGTGTAAGTGGAAGKAIASIGGASGSIINNLAGGQSFGVVE